MTFRSRIVGLFSKQTSSKASIGKQKRSRKLHQRSLFLEGLEGRQLLAAEVNVLGNGLTIIDGDTTPSLTDHTQFNNTLVGKTSTRTYTIQNLGDSDLELAAPTSTSARFAIQNFPAGPIAAGGSATFNVVFTPTAGAAVTATIQFDNNDADENPYNFNVTATGVVNSAPVFGTDPYAANLVENSPNNTNVVFVPAISASDVNTGIGDSYTFSIVSGNGTGSGAFKINPTTGQIQVNDVTQIDFEKTPFFSLELRVTDSLGAFSTAAALVALTQVAEPPAITAGQQFTIAENLVNSSNVGTVQTSFDLTSTLGSRSFTILSGNTGGAFAISSTGVLTVANVAALDFETVPLQQFTLSIRAQDNVGTGTATNVVVKLTNVNETPTDLILAPTDVAENQPIGTTVGNLSTTDQDAGNTFTYSFVPGAGDVDNASFTLDGSTLKTASSFNFENKNTYSVRLRTTDQGGLWFENVVTININNVNEGSISVSLSGDEIEENQPIGTLVGEFSTNDPDVGDTFTYTFVTGTGSTDNSRFLISGNQLLSNEVFDFETQSTYSIRVRSTDSGGIGRNKVFTVNILNAGDAPTDISLSNASVDENNSAGAVIGSLSTTDGDLLDTFTYSLVAGDGSDDNASFTLDGGVLKANVPFDADIKNSYSIRVRSTDSENLFVEKSFVITINDVFEAPTALLISNSSVVEEAPVGTDVGMFATADPDAGETFTYTLVDGEGSDDNASFSIVGNVLKTAAVFDYETKNTYTVRVRSTDSDNLTIEESFTVHVSGVRIGVPLAPPAAVNYKENAAPILIASVYSVIDVQLGNYDGGTLTASIINNGSANDRLSIKSLPPANNKVSVNYNTGTISYSTTALGSYPIGTFTGGVGTTPLVITFNSNAKKIEVQAVLKAINFETLSDNPSILPRTASFVITDGDGGTTNTVTRTINVVAVNDRPLVTASGTSVGYTENGPVVLVDPAVTVSDVDSADFNTGKLIVKVASGGNSSDRFGISPSGPITLDGASVKYDGVTIGTFAGTNSFIVTFNANATPAKVEDVARRVVYWSVSEAPTSVSATRNISFTVNDGDKGTSLAALGDVINITPENDAPALTLSNATPAKFTEKAAPTLISSGATVVDLDLVNFGGGVLTAAITANGTAADVLSIKNTGNLAGQVGVDYNLGEIRYGGVLVATYTGGDGLNPLLITFNNSALKVEVQAVMKAITFANSSNTPSTTTRTVSFTLTDGDGGTSNSVVRSVEVVAKNDPPSVANFGPDLDYTLTTTPILIADSATIADVDSADFNGGKLTVALGAGKNAADRVEILDGNGITAAAGVVSYNGDVIGSYAGTTSLVITFNSAFATPDAVQALLRQLTFKATVVGTSVTRVVAATLVDGDGGTSVAVNKTISVHNLIV